MSNTKRDNNRFAIPKTLDPKAHAKAAEAGKKNSSGKGKKK